MSTDVYHFFIRFTDGRCLASKRPYLSHSGAQGAMQGRLARMKPDRLAKLEATAVVKNVSGKNLRKAK